MIGCMSLIPEMMKQRRCDIGCHADDIALKTLKVVQESHQPQREFDTPVHRESGKGM
jgi:hypothetical protein